MRPLVEFPDVERPVRDYLRDELDALGEDVTVRVGVPANWDQNDPDQRSHVQVEWDGTPDILNSVAAFATVRLVAWATSTTEAKRLASRAQGVLCAHPGGAVIKGAIPLTGVLPATDPATNAEIAATTSRVTIRSAPIEPSGS